MSRIAEYANQVASGSARFPAMPTGPERCAQFVRMLCEQVGISPYQIGDVYGVAQRRGHQGEVWATDLEIGLRDAGKLASDLMPGDLLFVEGVSPPYGHVAIYLGNSKILHNSLYGGGTVVDGHVRVHNIEVLGTISSIMRIDAKSEADKAQATTYPAKYIPHTVYGAGSYGASDPPTLVHTPGDTVTAIGQNVNEARKGLFGGEISGQELTDPPLWQFNVMYPNEPRAPGWWDTEEFGPVPGLIVVRMMEDNELDFAMPILGPLSILGENAKDRALQAFRKLVVKEADTARYGLFLEPIEQFVTDPKKFRWPLPGVEGIHLRLESNGDARGEVTLFIADQHAAQTVHGTLCMIQRYRNAMVEIWLPHVFRDPKLKGQPGEEQLVLEPAFVGMVEEVTAAPWPSHITFKVLPQTLAQNRRGMSDDTLPGGGKRPITQQWQGKKIWEILQTIAKEHGFLMIGHSMTGLAGIPQLDRVIPVYDAMKRPPQDVIRELIEVYAGVKYQRVFGTELFGKDPTGRNLRAVYFVYDPGAWNPFSADFWKSGIFTALWGPLYKQITGVDAVGNICVFYPADLVEPDRIKDWADLLEVWASPESRFNPTGKHGSVMRRFLSTTLALTGNNPVGQSYDQGQVSEFHTALSDFMDGLLPKTTKRVHKTPVRVFSVEELTSRNPGESDMSNPLVGDPAGQGVQKASKNKVTAIQAADMMELKQSKDGQFILPTPTGPQTFRGSDELFLYYSANESRPSMVVPGSPAEDSMGFYPYTVTLRVEATQGVKIGMPACLVGFPRMDGMWEIQSIEYDLGGDRQDVLVTLRTARDLFAY